MCTYGTAPAVAAAAMRIAGSTRIAGVLVGGSAAASSSARVHQLSPRWAFASVQGTSAGVRIPASTCRTFGTSVPFLLPSSRPVRNFHLSHQTPLLTHRSLGNVITSPQTLATTPTTTSPLASARPHTTPQTLVRPHQIRCNSNSLHGRLFWRRRPRQVPVRRWNWRSKWLEGRPHTKGICTKVTIKSPKKPNSGNRKVARVKLKNGRTILAYIPGIGHNLQTHSVVLVRGRRTRDLIGCNYKLIRGKFDLLPVKDKKRARSKYGVKKPLKPNKWANTPERPWKRVYTDEMRRRYFFRTGKVIPEGEPVPHIPVLRKFPPFPIKGRTTKSKKCAKNKW